MDPEFLTITSNAHGAPLQVYTTNKLENSGSYTLQLVNVDMMKQQNITVMIDDKRRDNPGQNAVSMFAINSAPKQNSALLGGSAPRQGSLTLQRNR